MRKSYLIALVAASSIIFQTTYASAQTVNIQSFNDRTAWQTAVTSANANATIITENFQSATLQQGLTQTGGTIDTNTRVLNGAGLGTDFKYFGARLNLPLHELNFNPLITAVGGDWDMTGIGRGLELDLVFHLGNGTQWQPMFIPNPFDLIEQKYNPFKGFFGIVSDQPFENVIFWSIDSTASQSFTLSSLSFVQSSERAITRGDFKFLIGPAKASKTLRVAYVPGGIIHPRLARPVRCTLTVGKADID